MRKFAKLTAALLLAGTASTAHAQTEIQWWHAFTGQLGEALTGLANEFNASQREYKLVPVYKGSYAETMTAAIAAFRAKQPPHIVQVFEVGTATMMSAKGAIYPVHQLMADFNEKFDQKDFLSAVTGYYSAADGRLLSMPFNSSTPLMYWNKEMFQKAGLNPNVAPKTWPEVADAARKIVASGAQCGFTTDWQTWIQLENFSAWHNVPYSTLSNGFGGAKTELKFNSPLHVRHIQQLADWQKDKTFVYGGRENRASPKFTSGECGIFFGSTGSLGSINRSLGADKVGMGMLPYWPDVKTAPQNSIIGGATLWVLNGRPKAEYRGAAKFFAYISRPDVQAKWHQNTGYVPITLSAYKETLESGFYQKNPGHGLAVLQLTNKPATENSKGLRLGNFVQIRTLVDEELENVWAGKKTAQQGLDDAVRRGNEILRQFERANR